MLLNRVPGTFAFSAPGAQGIEPEFGVSDSGELFAVSLGRNRFEGNILFDDVFFLTRYAPDGSVLSETVTLDPRDVTPGASRFIGDLEPLEGGGFVTLFTYGIGSGRTPFVRVHDENGAPMTDFIEVPRLDTIIDERNQDGYSVSALPGGGFSVTIGEDQDNAGEKFLEFPDVQFGERDRGNDVRLVEFNADGTIARAPVNPHAVTNNPADRADNQEAFRHDSFDDGRIIVAFIDSIYSIARNSLASEEEIRLVILENGMPVQNTTVFRPPFIGDAPGGPFLQPSPSSANPSTFAPSAIVLEDGGFAIAYHLGSQSNGTVRVQFYDATGIALGEAVDTGIQGGGHEFAASPDGNLAMLTNSNEVRLLLIDETGVVDEALVEQVLGASNIDGIDVGLDGSIYVSSIADVVHRFLVGDNVQIGDENADNLTGTAEADVLVGAAGDDVLSGLAGDDQLEGGAGADQLAGGGGVNLLLGGEGEDTAVFDGTLTSFDMAEVADGGLSISRATETTTALFVENFQFSDQTLTADEVRALINAPEPEPEEPIDPPAPVGPTNNADEAFGTAENDTIRALGGDDTVNGQAGDDLLLGGSGDDVIRGAAGNDRLRGNGGDDRLLGGGGDDNIKGGGGADVIRGNGGNDAIRAGGGADNVKGGGGSDLIFGGGGADRLNGGGGSDTLRGNGGDDMLKGNGGRDVFQFRTSDRNDTILDFRQGQDKIQIQNGARSFEALSIDQDGRDVLIGFGAGQIRIVTDRATAFDESDFIF